MQFDRRVFVGGLLAGAAVAAAPWSALGAQRRADLVVDALRWSSNYGGTWGTGPVDVDADVWFEAVVRNAGKAAVAPGVTIRVGFLVNGTLVSWSNTYNNGLARGARVLLRANAGPDGDEFWRAVLTGTYTIRAQADDINGITESNESNNARTAVLSVIGGAVIPEQPWQNGKLQVSVNGRYFQHENGKPFLWFGDTTWAGIYRLASDAERRTYFSNRSAKGMTVIQAVVTGPWHDVIGGVVEDGSKNLYNSGVVPYTSQNPATPNSTFFNQVDSFLSIAAEYGLYVALSPAWGGYVCDAGQANHPEIFDATNATACGTWLGQRYATTKNLIWTIGGDRTPDDCGAGDLTIYRNLANAIKAEDPDHLMTYHPRDSAHSYDPFHSDSWLDFNSEQSWQNPDTIVSDISGAYGQSPAKPVIMIEPMYEVEAAFSQRIRRSQPYWTMITGGCGYNYGNQYIWAITRGEGGSYPFTTGVDWYERLDDASVVDHATWARIWKNLSWWKLAPDNSTITANAGTGTSQAVAAVASDGTFFVVYYPTNASRTINKAKITTSANANAKWIDPRDLAESSLGSVSTTGTQAWTPPVGWEDALLVLEAI